MDGGDVGTLGAAPESAIDEKGRLFPLPLVFRGQFAVLRIVRERTRKSGNRPEQLLGPMVLKAVARNAVPSLYAAVGTQAGVQVLSSGIMGFWPLAWMRRSRS